MSPVLACPDCRVPLDLQGHCSACGADYLKDDGVIVAIGKKSQLNLSEIDTQDHVSDYYENARYKLAFSRAYHEHTLDLLTDMAAPAGDVLDNGCGNGMFLEYLANKGFPIRTYVGTDISTGMLRHARGRIAAHTGSDTLLVRADACRLPFANASFDVVFARGLLHHLPDPAQGASEMARVLRPGGSVIVLDPNRTVISDLPRTLARKGKHFDEDHKNFRLDELLGYLSPHFGIGKVSLFGYVAYPLLGFPDLMNFGKYLPLDALGPWLTRLDDMISRIPMVNRLGWGVMVQARKT